MIICAKCGSLQTTSMMVNEILYWMNKISSQTERRKEYMKLAVYIARKCEKQAHKF